MSKTKTVIMGEEPSVETSRATAGASADPVNWGLLRLELRRSPGLSLFPLMVALMAWMIWDGIAMGVSLDGEGSFVIADTVILLGPLVGGIAAWMASREERRGTGELLSTTPRPAAARDLAAWAGTVAWCALAYLSVASAVLVLIYRNDPWAGTDILGPVLVGACALVTYSAVGYAAGHYLPNRFVAPLVPIALYLAQILPALLGYNGEPAVEPGSAEPAPLPVNYLSPADRGGMEYSVFYGILPDISLPRSLWLLGLAGVALAAVVLHGRRSPVSWGALAASATVAVVGAAMLLQAPMPVNDAQKREALIPYEPVCEKDQITVCAHPAYKASLRKDAAVINRLAEPLVGVPGVPKKAEQKPNYRQPETDGTLPYFPSSRTTRKEDQAVNAALNLVDDHRSP
ncbi:MAG: hypothetical protein M3R38_07795 [Actinomycetota bacterium]|nr:hypothetical protein [Actinomycetota bacterium]MDP9484556.1 hypothetical protein [Actinomycetota bacterium]